MKQVYFQYEQYYNIKKEKYIMECDNTFLNILNKHYIGVNACAETKFPGKCGIAKLQHMVYFNLRFILPLSRLDCTESTEN